jgi:hypothetical protein
MGKKFTPAMVGFIDPNSPVDYELLFSSILPAKAIKARVKATKTAMPIRQVLVTVDSPTESPNASTEYVSDRKRAIVCH